MLNENGQVYDAVENFSITFIAMKKFVKMIIITPDEVVNGRLQG